MKRSPLRRRAPLRGGKPLRAKRKLKAKKRPARRTKIKPVNPKRLKRLRAMQGLDGPKARWIRSMACCVTGHPGTEEWPIDVAHVGKTRAAGGGPEQVAPLWRPVHSDFDSLPADVFEAKYGFSKDMVRAQADDLEREWQRLCAEVEA